MFEKITEKRFKTLLEKIRYGSMLLTMPDGTCEFFEGSEPGPHADLGIDSWSVIQNLSTKGEVGFAEDYRDGKWDSTNLEELFAFAMRNDHVLSPYLDGNWVSRLIAQIGYLFRMNSIQGSRRNIHAHYDLGNEFYKLWLDPTMTYSSALYKRRDENLASAQINKYDRLLDRIEDPRGSILEIGCGWGGFAERALERNARDIKGLTLSTEQLAYAQNRLKGEAEFKLEDYRQATGLYDSIVSIEMFEAVGIAYWKQYFDQLKRLMRNGGKALVQSIVIEDKRFEQYRKGSDVIRSFIFPGGMLPSDERFTAAAQTGGLKVTDRFSFGQDYAQTLREWRDKFEAALPEIRSLGFDDGFIRLWRYYLTTCSAGFREGRINVTQFEMQHQ